MTGHNKIIINIYIKIVTAKNKHYGVDMFFLYINFDKFVC